MGAMAMAHELEAQHEEEEGEIVGETRVGEDAPKRKREGEENTPRRKKKKQRKRVEQGKGNAQDYVDVYGPDARAAIELRHDGEALRVLDLQGLLLWVLGDGMSPKWAFVRNKPLVRRVVMVMASGLDMGLIERKKHLMERTMEVLGKPLPFAAVASTANTTATIGSLLSVQRKRKQKEQLVKINREARPPLPPTHYTMSPAELKDNNYPIPILLEDQTLACPEGYVATQPAGKLAPGSPGAPAYAMLSLDCEMCYTKNGLELTRVTVLDENHKEVYDQFVQPEDPILDYNTKYSGITAETLNGVTKTLHEVQLDFLRIVALETILVGHSLENDLCQLRVIHPNVVDTSLLYPHPRGPPFKPGLRFLTEKFLGRKIQEETHCSAQDANAAMELALLKFQNGPTFGEIKQEGEPLLELLARLGHTSSLVDRRHILHKFASGNANAIVCGSDDDVVAKLKQEASNGNATFIWGHLNGLSEFYNQRMKERQFVAHHGSSLLEHCTTPENLAKRFEEEEKIIDSILVTIDRRIAEIYDHVEPNTLVMVTSGHGNTAMVKKMMEERHKRKQGVFDLPGWTDWCEELLTQSVNEAKRGLCFVSMKQ